MEHGHGLYSYLNLESTKTNVDKPKPLILLYSYLNLESTKTVLKEIEITE